MRETLLERDKALLQAAPYNGAEELRRGLTVRQLQGMTDLMKQYCLECRYNVGVGHVLGALCAGWEKLL